MIYSPFEERVVQLKGYTDSVNKRLESAQVPYFEDGVIRFTRTYLFEDEMRTSVSKPTYKVDILTWQTHRKRCSIDTTIHTIGKSGETISKVSAWCGVPTTDLLTLNPTIDINTDIYGMNVDLGIVPTVSNLVKLNLIKPIVVFLDGLFVPMDHVTVVTDLINDHIMIDTSCFADKSLIRDKKNICIYTYKYASDNPDDYPLISFDKNGMITSIENEVVYTLYAHDTATYSEGLFVDPQTQKGTFGHMFNETVNLPYMNKIKPENIFVFQQGRHITNAEVTTHNYNILNVRFPEFAEDSRAVVIYKKSVLYTEDNALRVNHNVAKEIQPLFEDYLDDVENSVQRFIDEIYLLTDNKYGIHFERIGIDNVEEGSTPADEMIWYTTDLARRALKHLASEIFEKDKPSILELINDIIDKAYHEEYFKFECYDEWHLRKNLPEMFLHTEDEDPKYYDNYNYLDESFDFKFFDRKTLNHNMLDAIAYIANYDSDKLECALPRYEVSACCDGKALRYFVTSIAGTPTLRMRRYNWNRRENYVMIFKNGELIDTYESLVYEPLDFVVPISDFTDDDKFEIVYYLKVTNRVFPVYANDSIITSRFWFDEDEVELWDDKTPNGEYSVSGKNQVYRVPFQIWPPLARYHGSPTPPPGPTPSGGGVDIRNGPVFHFDDSDIGYDGFIYITNDDGMTAVTDLINSLVPAATYPDINGLLLDMADNAKNNSVIYTELALRLHLQDTLSIPKYTSYSVMPDPTLTSLETIVKYIGETSGSFVNANYYQVQLDSSNVHVWAQITKPSDADTPDPIERLMLAIEEYAELEPDPDPDPDPPEPDPPGPTPDPPIPETWWFVPGLPDIYESPRPANFDATKTDLYKLYLTAEDLLIYENDLVWITSKRQFHYHKFTVSDSSQTSYQLPNKFRYATNVNKYLIFVNHLLTPRGYVVIVPRENNPVGYITLYPEVRLESGDIIEVFYVPDEMTNDFKEEVLPRTATTNSGYIKINKNNTMTGISRNSAFVFLNGRKIRYCDVLDISSNIVKITDESQPEAAMTTMLDVYRFLYSNSDYTLRAYAPSKLEELIPPKPNKMDALMDSFTEPCGKGIVVFNDRLGKDAVKEIIKQDFVETDPNAWLVEF